MQCSNSDVVKSSIGWLATTQVFCWSLLNLSEQHSCTFLIDIFPWKHALHCTNPVAKEWALVRFFFSFCGIFFFFSLSHTLSLPLTALRTELTYHLFQCYGSVLHVCGADGQLSPEHSRRRESFWRWEVRHQGLWDREKWQSPPQARRIECFSDWLRGWTKGDQWTKLADPGRRFILEVCWFEDVANWEGLWWLARLIIACFALRWCLHCGQLCRND